MKTLAHALGLFGCSRLIMLAAPALPDPEQLPAHAEPPPALVSFGGKPITTLEQWRSERVPELRALFENYEYGTVPRHQAPLVAEVVHEDTAALGGKAILREVKINLGEQGSFYLLLLIPKERRAPVASFVGLNFTGNHTTIADPKVRIPEGWFPAPRPGVGQRRATEDGELIQKSNRAIFPGNVTVFDPELTFKGEKLTEGRGTAVDVWAFDQAIARGYASATLWYGDIDPDRHEPGDPALGSDRGSIARWAAGLIRAVDYLRTSPELDPQRIAAVGHSRNGKAAMLAGAFDERIALVVANQAGCGGTAPCRVPSELTAPQANGRPLVETVAMINKSFPHWFSAHFKRFDQAPERLPFDQHSLIALCAPRPVLLSNATEDRWANPPGQFAMLRAADPVYRLIANDGVGAETMPEVGKLLDSRLGYYIRAGKHSMTREDWKVWLDYADKWLR